MQRRPKYRRREQEHASEKRAAAETSKTMRLMGSLADLAAQLPDQIERSGDKEPRAGLLRQVETAAERHRAGRARPRSKAERARDRVAGPRRAASVGRGQVGEHDRGRAPGEFDQEVRRILVGRQRDDRDAWSRRNPVARERSASTAARLNGTCAPSNTSGTRERAEVEIVPLHPADQPGGGARPGVEQPGADRLARARARPLRPSWSRTAAGERDVRLLDGRAGRGDRANDRTAEFVGAGLNHAAGLVVAVAAS